MTDEHLCAERDAKLTARFWLSVTKKQSDECWEWTGRRNADGYGVITVRSHPVFRCREQLAHRVSWYLGAGSLPDGAQVLHRCDNPPCINPSHLWLGTPRDNMRDCAAKGRTGGGGPRGESSPHAKLTEEQVRRIRELAGIVAQRKIAKLFGVCQTTVGKIIRSENWRAVI